MSLCFHKDSSVACLLACISEEEYTHPVSFGWCLPKKFCLSSHPFLYLTFILRLRMFHPRVGQGLRLPVISDLYPEKYAYTLASCGIRLYSARFPFCTVLTACCCCAASDLSVTCVFGRITAMNSLSVHQPCHKKNLVTKQEQQL
jgi:hypothetical protein